MRLKGLAQLRKLRPKLPKPWKILKPDTKILVTYTLYLKPEALKLKTYNPNTLKAYKP